MVKIIKENREFYNSPIQRELLIELVKEPMIAKNFFLTGGTALSVFYLYHRQSDDLDLFTIQRVNLSEISLWLKRKWKERVIAIKESGHFLSLLIDSVKVEFVIDPLSFDEERPFYTFEKGLTFSIDTINNIASNKFNACVSRVEAKDYVDFYFILKKYPDMNLDDLYSMTSKKDAIFDDYPTVAFQIEEGVGFIKRNKAIMPKIKVDFDFNDFLRFYERLTIWVYERGRT